MHYRTQKTISHRIVFNGKCLHSGRIVKMIIEPAVAGTGIIFHRTDCESAIPVLAHAFNISSTELSTTIGEGASSVATIEHLMASLAGVGIDNAIIKINGHEVPIMDGSALPFLQKILAVGVKDLEAPKVIFKVEKPFEISHGDQKIRIEPSDSDEINCSIDFDREMIGFQSIKYIPNLASFMSLSNARTFCHINDVNIMRQQGLALGGSLENAVVVTDTGVMNKEGLRSPDEFVRHKLLDLIGDFALLGGALQGKITANKPGHTLHAEFMLALLENKEGALRIIKQNSQEENKDVFSDSILGLASSAFAQMG